MTRTRYKIFDTSYPYLLTATTVEWMPLLSNNEVLQIIIDSMRFLHESGRMTLFGYVIMPDHIHVAASGDNLSSEFGNFKSYTARRIIDHYKNINKSSVLKKLSFYKKSFKKDRDFQLWQEGNKPKQISNRGIMIQKINYIHNNPVRCGYVDRPEHWIHSSARNYSGENGIISVCQDW